MAAASLCELAVLPVAPLPAAGAVGLALEVGCPGGVGQALMLKLRGWAPTLVLPVVLTPPHRPGLFELLKSTSWLKLRMQSEHVSWGSAACAVSQSSRCEH